MSTTTEAAKSDAKDGEAKSEAKGESKDSAPEPTRLGRFIQTYHGFLSSFVIGAAGLIATSIWQYKQSEIARRQAESQQKVAETKAQNDWKIERAEILSKNLQVLSLQGANSVEQKYGVLLSLTRGNILDPELAVSYALELGKESPDYMRSVLANTTDKDYFRLLHSFALTCAQRLGVAREVEVCKDDRLAARSSAIAGLIADEIQAAWATGRPGPMVLLRDERQVQQQPARLAWLFTPALTEFYERRQWNEINRFQQFSAGAHLVAALVLAAARTGEFVSDEEAGHLSRFHADQRKWLTGYLFGKSCDGECKGRLVDVMLSAYAEAQGDYDQSMRRLLESSHAEAGAAVARLHARLLWCQVDADDLVDLRDRVFVPALVEMLGKPKAERALLDDLIGLLALTPEPTEREPATQYKSAVTLLQRTSPEQYQRVFVDRRATAKRERDNPPPAMKKVTFCNATARPSDEDSTAGHP